MVTLMTDSDRYEELAAASRRVIRSWDQPGELAPAVNELRETLEAHGTDEEGEDDAV